MTAPAPMVTNSAGSAQHKRVDVLAKRESVGANNMRLEIGSVSLAIKQDVAARDYFDLVTGFLH